MPPPMAQQGSRTGLIATLVIFVVLFMVAVIMWIYTNTQLTKATTEKDQQRQKYDAIVAASDVAGDNVTALTGAREKLGADAPSTAVEIAVAEIRRLTALITGTAAPSFADADAKAQQAMDAAGAVLNPKKDPKAATQPSGDSLVATIEKLTAAAKAQAASAADAKKQLAAVQAAVDTKSKNWDDQLAKANASVAELTTKYGEAMKALEAAQQQYMEKQKGADEGAKKATEDAGNQVQTAQTAVAQAKADLVKAEKQIKDLQAQLQKTRVDTKNSVVRQADGYIVRVPSSSVAYISLGQGDHISAGITFEVYDKNEGVPPLGKDPMTDSGLPAGKASIEVVRVGQNSSECRIVHMASGATIQEGDIIANLVYDKNTTYNFVVYGNFDTDGNGVWTAQEADVIRSLVTRWGGKVQDKIAVSTDFLVLGKEPEIPVLTKEQQDDPILKAKYDKAVQESKEYQDRINEASTLGIPIMNQNRFLYYVGYFDQIRR